MAEDISLEEQQTRLAALQKWLSNPWGVYRAPRMTQSPQESIIGPTNANVPVGSESTAAVALPKDGKLIFVIVNVVNFTTDGSGDLTQPFFRLEIDGNIIATWNLPRNSSWQGYVIHQIIPLDLFVRNSELLVRFGSSGGVSQYSITYRINAWTIQY